MAVRQATGAGGLPTLLLAHPSGSTAELYLHGAHLTSWIPAGSAEALFLSRAAAFGPGRAIRGGVPVIFPQFAATGPLPRHGFARTAPWEWVGGEEAGGAAVARLRLQDGPDTRALWPHSFVAEVTVELEARTLAIGLRVDNPGPAPFSFTAALHTYLRVADVRRASVEGLQGVAFRDQTEGGAERVDAERELRVVGEVDRIYLGAPPELRLHDPVAGRSVRIASRGFTDVVVWNPGLERARALPDLREEEYLETICVEAAQVGTPVELPPSSRWRGEQRLRIE